MRSKIPELICKFHEAERGRDYVRLSAMSQKSRTDLGPQQILNKYIQ